MQRKYHVSGALAALTFTSLVGCVVVPFGEGSDRGHDHEQRDRHDGDREHRQNFGVNQKEPLGLGLAYCRRSDLPLIRSAVFVPCVMEKAILPVWS